MPWTLQITLTWDGVAHNVSVIMERSEKTRSWASYVLLTAGLIAVVGVTALQKRNQTRLEEENSRLKEQVNTLQDLQNKNPSAEEFQQILAALKARDFEEITQLRNQVSELRKQTNRLQNFPEEHAKALIGLGGERWERAYRHLESQFTGKPRVPRVGAWIGVDISDPGENDRGIDQTDGTIVRRVVPNGPAAEAKIEPGDVIVSIDDAAVRNTEEFKTLLAQRNGAQTLKLRIIREGTPLAINVNASDWPQ